MVCYLLYIYLTPKAIKDLVEHANFDCNEEGIVSVSY